MPTPSACIPIRVRLTIKPGECAASAAADAPRGLVFAGIELTGMFVGHVRAEWMGPEALQFFKDHHDELRPGRSVDLEVYGIQPFKSESCAKVKTCQLAPLPPTWAKHAEKLSTTH